MKLTLCGSARYEPYWHEANKLLGLSGHICYSLMTFPSIEDGNKSWYTPDQKWMLDLAHFAKIEESDGIVLLNIDHYLGESSTRELLWARLRQKKVFWTLPDPRMLPSEVTVIGGIFHGFDSRSPWQELLNNITAKLPITHQQV